MSNNMINWEKDADGIVVLTMDDPNQGANTMNQLYKESMGATVDRLEAELDSITGVVLTSAKKTFFAGGDLNNLLAARPEDAQLIFDEVQTGMARTGTWYGYHDVEIYCISTSLNGEEIIVDLTGCCPGKIYKVFSTDLCVKVNQVNGYWVIAATYAAL